MAEMNVEDAKFERNGTTIQDGTIHIRFSRPRMPTFPPLRERLSKMLQNARATIRPRYIIAIFSSFVFFGLLLATFIVSLRTHSMASCACSKPLSTAHNSYPPPESEVIGIFDAQNATNEYSDALSCKSAWLLIKRCDYAEHSQGGKCTYASPTGYEFSSETSELQGNEKATIVAKLKEYARAEGVEMHLEVNETAEKHYTTVDVPAGQELSAYRKGYYCGKYLVWSPELKLVTNDSNHAHLSVVCKPIVESLERNSPPHRYSVASPNYPDFYADRTDRTYILFSGSPANAALRLTIDVFDTEAQYDTLIIYDGLERRQLANHSGILNVPVTYISSGPIMTLRFRSDEAVTSRGWHAVFETVRKVS